jgi:hypothetical protein
MCHRKVGTISSDTLVHRAGWGGWRRIGEVEELQTATSPRRERAQARAKSSETTMRAPSPSNDNLPTGRWQAAARRPPVKADRSVGSAAAPNALRISDANIEFSVPSHSGVMNMEGLIVEPRRLYDGVRALSASHAYRSFVSLLGRGTARLATMAAMLRAPRHHTGVDLATSLLILGLYAGAVSMLASALAHCSMQ